MSLAFSPALTLALAVLLTVFNRQFCLAAADDDDGAILVLGDSWASLSGSFLADVCSLGSEGSGSTSTSSSRPLTNNGKSGSTAQQWASGKKAVDSFQKAEHDYDYVWLSIGGNDFNCNVEKHDAISDNILAVITDIFESSSNDNIQVLYTGYGYPSENICGGGSNVDVTPLFDHLSTTILDKIGKSPYADKVLTVNILSLYVTNESEPYSDKTWYADDIHINRAGYIKLFSMSEIQQFFGCTTLGTTPAPVPLTTAPLMSTPAPSISCVDSPLRFKVIKNGQKITRDCRWVATRSTNWRCSFGGVKLMCPLTCNHCAASICVDAPNRLQFEYKGRKATRDCEWVGRKDVFNRCNVSGVDDTCRATCDLNC